MKQLKNYWVAVRHGFGFADDGLVELHGGEKPQPIPPDVGINRKKGTWTTVHPVYYDEHEEVVEK